MGWVQTYDPVHNVYLSTLLAASPVVVLLALLGIFGWPAPRAALAGLLTSLLVAVAVFGMPVSAACASAAYGAAYGLFPIGWIVLMAIFLYSLTVETGQFEIVKNSVAALSGDQRIQAVIIAFSFGAFVEGAAGFGTPVAISAALMIGAGFPPLHAAGLALIANTAPVAFGALGTPITMLHNVTNLDEMALSAMAGRQLPFFSLIIPAWMVWVMAGWRGMLQVWPAILVSGGSFAAVHVAVSNWLGPTLVDVTGGLISLFATTVLLKFWKPSSQWTFSGEANGSLAGRPPSAITLLPRYSRKQIVNAWVPWALLSICVFLWGVPRLRNFFNALGSGKTQIVVEVPGLHKLISRSYPVVAEGSPPEKAEFTFNWLSATGTGILIAAVLSAAWMGVRPGAFLKTFRRTLQRMRWPLFTIAAMMAIAYMTRYSGIDATLGLAFTKTGVVYPFFAAMLGWLGVALTGSDTSSNALFGSLQKITAENLGLNPILICAANSTGGVMGKMIDAQSIVVSAAATDQPGREGPILRYVFWHSVTLAALMGLLTLLQAYLFPWMIPEPG